MGGDGADERGNRIRRWLNRHWDRELPRGLGGDRADGGDDGVLQQIGHLVGGAVITEYIFGIPGVGRLVVDAIFARDYPLTQGVVMLTACGFLAVNFAVDVLYAYLNPRIRYTS